MAGALTKTAEGSIRPSDRNPLLGLSADALAYLSKFLNHPDGTAPLKLVGGMVDPVAKTLDRMSYGDSLGTGSGMTWKPHPETVDTALTFAPFAQDAALAMKGMPIGMSTKLLGAEIPAASGMASEALAKAGPEIAGRIVQSPKEVTVARKFLNGEKKGIIRGTEGFGRITSQKLRGMRENYMQKMEEGVDGRLWYDNSSKDIMRWVGGDPSKADDFANMLATTSARTPVNSNLMYSNKGWNQHLLGEPIKTGGFPKAMGQTITETLANPEAANLGLKRSPFSAGLSVEWRGPEFANRPTHDIHDVRAWGIKDPQTGEVWSKGVPDAGHRFLDEQSAVVTQRANEQALGGVTDWNPYRGQAAAWISQKARHEGTPIDAAARHYGSFAPDYQAMITREWVPGTNTGHLPEIQTAAPAARKEYSDALEALVSGRDGIDKLASDSGALVDRTHPNLGFYEGDTNPGYTTRLNVGKAPGSQDMDPASAKVADALASAHGLLGTQKQVAHNYAGNPVAVKDAGVVRFPGAATDAEMTQFYKSMIDLGGDVPMRDPAGGLRVLNFGSADERKAFAKAVTPPKWAPTGMYPQPEFRAQSGNLIPFEAPENWSSKPFIEAIDAAGPQYAEKLSKAMQPVAGGVLDTVSALAAKNGWTQAEWFKPMMEGLRDGGIPRLKELVKAGVVPAAFMADEDMLTAIGNSGLAPQAGSGE